MLVLGLFDLACLHPRCFCFAYSNTVLNRNTPQISPICETRKVTVETISKQLEYITKSYIATIYNIILNLKLLYSSVPFSSLVL